MKTKKETHTSGPWTYSVTNEGNIGSKDKVRVEGPDGHIAIACRVKRSERNTYGNVGIPRALPEVKANARLIAAAPDLLEALKQVRIALAPYAAGSQEMPTSPGFMLKVEQMARAAIAKAEVPRA